MCLRYIAQSLFRTHSLFGNHSTIYDGAFLQKLLVFCGRHNRMISNVKKVMFLALVPVLPWNSHPHFLVYVHSKCNVTKTVVNLQEWNQNTQLQIFIQANIIMW